MAAGAHPLGASPRAELACLRDRRAKTLAWKARMSQVSYLHRGLQAKARRAWIAISMTERSCGIAFPVKCPEPHSGGAGRKSRKNRLFLSLRIPYFPHFTRWPPHFPQNPLSFLPFPTRGIWPVAPEVVAKRAASPGRFDTSDDVSEADWRKCGSCVGGADRSSSAVWLAPSGSCRCGRRAASRPPSAKRPTFSRMFL